MSRGTASWSLTLFGSALLLDIVAHVLRPPAGFSGWDYLDAALTAGLVVAIWYTYHGHLRALDRLSTQIDKPTLDHLRQSAFLIALCGLLLPLPLRLIRHG